MCQNTWSQSQRRLLVYSDTFQESKFRDCRDTEGKTVTIPGMCQNIPVIVSVSDSSAIVGSRDIASSDRQARSYITRELEPTVQSTGFNQYFSPTPSPPRVDGLSPWPCHVPTGIYGMQGGSVFGYSLLSVHAVGKDLDRPGRRPHIRQAAPTWYIIRASLHSTARV